MNKDRAHRRSKKKGFALLSLKLPRKIVPIMALLTPIVATAASIDLKSPDGAISLSGELLAYDGETITVLTEAGQVSLAASRVLCVGEDCPASMQSDADDIPTVTIATSNADARAIANSFLKTTTASSSRRVISGNAESLDPAGVGPALVSFVPASTATTNDIIVTDENASETNVAIAAIQDWVHDTAPSQLLAATALSVVTAPDAGVDRLTLTQIARILAGEVVNWAEVGGADVDLTLFLTHEDSRLYENLQALIMRPARKPITPAFVTLQDANQINKSVKVTPGGFSLIPQEFAEGGRTLGVTDQCGVTTWPTDFAVRSGTYPLTLSTLALFPSGRENTLIQTAFDKAAMQNDYVQLAETIKSSQALIHQSEADKVDRFVKLMSQDLSDTEKEDAARLIAHLIDADQLSVSFSGGDQSQTQGAWARTHFVRLRDAIASGAFDGQEILFVGYAQNADTGDAVTASKAAADSILDAFTTFAPNAATRDTVQFRAIGHGTLGHTACATLDGASFQTPRIEVWSHPAPVSHAASHLK